MCVILWGCVCFCVCVCVCLCEREREREGGAGAERVSACVCCGVCVCVIVQWMNRFASRLFLSKMSFKFKWNKGVCGECVNVKICKCVCDVSPNLAHVRTRSPFFSLCLSLYFSFARSLRLSFSISVYFSVFVLPLSLSLSLARSYNGMQRECSIVSWFVMLKAKRNTRSRTRA